MSSGRSVQEQRFADSSLICNAEMTPTEVRKYCQALLDEKAQPLLKLAMTSYRYRHARFIAF